MFGLTDGYFEIHVYASLKGEKKEKILLARVMAVVLLNVGFTAYADREEAENQRRVLAAAREVRILDLSHPAFAEKIYRFFGSALSWAEETAEGER